MLKRFAKGKLVTDRMLVAQLRRDVAAEGGVRVFAKTHRIAAWSVGRLLGTTGSRCNPGPAIARLYGLRVERKAVVYRAAR